MYIFELSSFNINIISEHYIAGHLVKIIYNENKVLVSVTQITSFFIVWCFWVKKKLFKLTLVQIFKELVEE